MKKMLSIVTAALLALSTFSLFAAQVEASPECLGWIYVDDDNVTGPWDGTPEHPYQNITSGLEHAGHGDCIFVYGGIYHERVTIDKEVRLVAENREDTIIDGSGNGTVVEIQSWNVRIVNFTIRNGGENGRGIHVHGYGDIILSGNELSNNEYGIYVARAEGGPTISGNIAYNNEYGIFLHNSALSNVSENIAYNNGYGIYLLGCGGSKVTGNTASNNGFDGIVLDVSGNSFVERNYAGSNHEDGFWIHRSGLSSVQKNIAKNNHLSGFHIGGSGASTIEKNRASNNDYGFRFDNTATSNIRENTIINNQIGMSLYFSDHNFIYHNNFINNINQVDIHPWLNLWDDGYPSGGNYWSDYTDVDIFKGPDQNETGSDGIWDHAYTIIDDVQYDNYPLVDPFPMLDLNVYTDKYRYSLGDAMHLGLDVENLDGSALVGFKLWVELPDGSTHTVLNLSSVTIPEKLMYSNPSFKSFTLPSLQPGIYVWHAAFVDTMRPATIVEDTAEWMFS